MSFNRRLIVENGNNYTVYIHTSPSKKAYIGITSTSVEDRWDNGNGYLKKRKNGKYKQPAMANAIIKYGWENFEHIIFERNLSKEDAEHMEKLLIELFQTRNKLYGYNIREGGGSTGKMAEESRLKMINSLNGRKHTEEELRKMSEAHKGEKNPNYGKHLSDETRKKMSEAKKGVGPSEYCREKAMQVIRKRIMCIEMNLFFNSIAEASRILNIPRTTINSTLTGRLKHAGYHPETHEPLHWEYV
jgi:group I intron endonuclease